MGSYFEFETGKCEHPVRYSLETNPYVHIHNVSMIMRIIANCLQILITSFYVVTGSCTLTTCSVIISSLTNRSLVIWLPHPRSEFNVYKVKHCIVSFIVYFGCIMSSLSSFFGMCMSSIRTYILCMYMYMYSQPSLQVLSLSGV